MKLLCLVSLLFLVSLSLVAQGRNIPEATESGENDSSLGSLKTGNSLEKDSSLGSLETGNSLEKDSSLDNLDRHVGWRDHLTDSNTLFPHSCSVLSVLFLHFFLYFSFLSCWFFSWCSFFVIHLLQLIIVFFLSACIAYPPSTPVYFVNLFSFLFSWCTLACCSFFSDLFCFLILFLFQLCKSSFLLLLFSSLFCCSFFLQEPLEGRGNRAPWQLPGQDRWVGISFYWYSQSPFLSSIQLKLFPLFPLFFF